MACVACASGATEQVPVATFNGPVTMVTAGDTSGGTDDTGTSADTEATDDTAEDPPEGSTTVTSSNTTAEAGVCGNGIMDGTESCDGEDLGGQSCADFAFDDGVLLCNPECGVLTDGCRTCGDGMMSAAEACDGVLVGAETCETQGFGGGTLGCAADCSGLDTSGCTPLASCGDGVRNKTEECDSADLGGQTCESLGFDFGVLSCGAGSCQFNVSGCDYLDCAGAGEFCFFDPDDPQGPCCPPGIGGNTVGLCVLAFCQ